jgi:osmotically-inducible protein OsmY
MLAGYDREILQQIRREIIRRQAIDGSQINVFCNNGVVELMGTLRVLPHAKDVSPQQELDKIKEICMRCRGVKDVLHRYLRVL